ncbi:hypothetical protein ACFLUZ_01345 [Chloroflexota bacterium]
MKRPRRYVLNRVLMILCGLIVGLLCVEGGLRGIEAFGSPDRDLASRQQKLIPDEKLGNRVAPYAAGHDANGFRNDVAPGQADIVAIGDSMTWGYSAYRSQAWPQTLASLSGHSTYNMGLGGYGPVEYWVLSEEALRLSPKIIVIGLYFGNDIADAYRTVYLSDMHPQFRSSEADSALFTDTIAPKANAVMSQRTEHKTWIQRSIFYKWAIQLREHSAALRTLTDGLQRLINPMYQQGKAWAEASPGHAAVYENNGIRTVFTPAKRLIVLDMDECRVVEGLRITKEMLLLIHGETERADVKLLILFIPTKEIIYADAMEASQGHLEATYYRLVQMEEQVMTEISLLCRENGIEFVDTLPEFREAVQRNEKIFPEHLDGHPIASGYFVIASAVQDTLTRLGWLRPSSQ